FADDSGDVQRFVLGEREEEHLLDAAEDEARGDARVDGPEKLGIERHPEVALEGAEDDVVDARDGLLDDAAGPARLAHDDAEARLIDEHGAEELAEAVLAEADDVRDVGLARVGEAPVGRDAPGHDAAHALLDEAEERREDGGLA